MTRAMLPEIISTWAKNITGEDGIIDAEAKPAPAEARTYPADTDPVNPTTPAPRRAAKKA